MSGFAKGADVSWITEGEFKDIHGRVTRIAGQQRVVVELVGRSLLDCHNPESRDKIQQVVDWFAVDESHNIVYTFHNEKQNKDVYMVALRDDGKLIGYYEKHEYRNTETMKQYDLW